MLGKKNLNTISSKMQVLQNLHFNTKRWYCPARPTGEAQCCLDALSGEKLETPVGFSKFREVKQPTEKGHRNTSRLIQAFFE